MSANNTHAGRGMREIGCCCENKRGWVCLLLKTFCIVMRKNVAYSIPKADTMSTVPEHLLRALPLSAADAARLVLELVEGLQLGAHSLGHDALMERLRGALRLGAAAVRQREQTVPFEEAAWRSVEARAQRRPVTLRDLRYYVRRLLRQPGLGARPLRAMGAPECRRVLQVAFGHSPHGFRKARAILHSVFAFGMQQGWCALNPVDHIASPAVQEKEIRPLSAEAIERLLRATRRPEHRAMLLPLHLMLYCGVRPAEVQRLRAADVDWQEGVVRIRPTVSKTGGGRVVPLRFVLPPGEQVAPGCSAAPAGVIPRGWERRRGRMRLPAARGGGGGFIPLRTVA